MAILKEKRERKRKKSGEPDARGGDGSVLEREGDGGLQAAGEDRDRRRKKKKKEEEMGGDFGRKEERRKEKRKRVEGVGEVEEQGDSGRRKVDDELNGFMPASRIVHALRNPKVPVERKIEVVGRFIRGYEEQRRQQEGGVNVGVEWIAITQFVSFLSDWVQSAIIKSCKDVGGNTKQGRELLPACLNAEVWNVLRWCLSSGHLGGVGSISLSILKGVGLAFSRGGVVDGRARDSGEGNDGAEGLMEVLAEVLHILFTQHERTFRPSPEQWLSLAMAALELEHAKGLNSVESLKAGIGPLHLLVLVVMEGFARFVSWYPNPRTVYDGVVEKLLGPLFVSLGGLRWGSSYPQNEELYVWRNRYQKALEDVLREGLFHPAHIGDYADACAVLASRKELLASREDFEGEQYGGTVLKKGTGRHYQRRLFEKLHYLRSEGSSVALGTVGFVLRAYAQRLKAQSAALVQDVYGVQGKEKAQAVGQDESKDTSGRKDKAQGGDSKDTEGDQPEKEDAAEGDDLTRSQAEAGVAPRSQTQSLRQSEQLFAVFAELVGPIVEEVGQLVVDFPFKDLERGGVIMRRVVQLFDAVNSLLSAAKDEHVYVPTEDTPKETHLVFLRAIQDILMKAAKVVPQISRTVENQAFAMSTASLMRQVVSAVGHLLDLEYRVTEQHLADVWLTLLNAVAVGISYEAQDSGTRDPEPFSEVMQVACRIIQTYSDLRQVDRPLLVLCSCLRTLTTGNLPAVGAHCWLVSSAVETIVASKPFLQTLAVAVRNLPEGQTAQVVRVLAADLNETIELYDRIPSSTKKSHVPLSEIHGVALQTAAATKGLSEIYSCVLENVNVTATNSIPVGASVRNAVTSGISLPLGNLIDMSSIVSPQAINGEADGSLQEKRKKRSKVGTVSSAKSAVGSRPEDDELNASKAYFLLRTFLACRSLDRQCRGLMPPKAAKKANAEVGEPAVDVFGRSSGEVARTLKDRTFFSWIGQASKWMPDVLKGIQEKTGNKHPPLAYLLDCVAIQRIVDLKRQLRILEFLPGRFDAVEPLPSQKHDSALMAGAVLSLKQELTSLVAFVCRGLSSVRQSIDEFSPNCAENDNGKCGHFASNSGACQVEWDTIVATLKPETLPVARWRLLCLTVDVWSEHATASKLSDFVSCLLASYLCRNRPNKGLDGVSVRPQMTSVHGITEELLKDALLYEQCQLQKVFASVFWERVLGHVHAVLQVSTFNQDGHQIDLQDAEHLTSIVERIKEEFRSPPNLSSQNGSLALKPLKKSLRKLRKLVTGVKTDCNPVQDLEQCARLLDLLCSLPQGYFTASDTAVHILHLAEVERFLVYALLNIRVAVCSKHTEMLSCDAGHNLRNVVVHLLKIFVGCRRAFKCLSALGSSERETTGSKVMCKLFESREAASWFSVSIYAATAVLVDLQKLWQGHDSTCSSEWAALYAVMSNSRQTMSNICGSVFYQDASSLLTVSWQEDSSDVSDHLPDLKSQEAMIQVAQSLHEQLQQLESCLKPAGSDFKVDPAVNPVSKRDWFRALTVLSEVSSYFGSMVSAIEDLNEKCYHSENRDLTWQAELPSTWLQSIQNLEPILVKYLLNLVVPIGSDAVLSASCPKSGEPAKPVNLKEALNEWQEDDKMDATSDLRDCQEADESSGDDSDDAGADDLDLDTHLSKQGQGQGMGQLDLNGKQSDDEDEAGSIDVHNKEWGMFETCILVPGVASSEALELQKRMIHCILEGTDDLRSQCVGELFLGLAALLRLRSLCFSPCAVGTASKSFAQFGGTGKYLPQWVKVQLGAAYWLLLGAGSSIHLNRADNKRWLLGVSKFMESSGNLLSCVSPSIPLPVFSKLVELHITLLGALAPSKHEIRQTEVVPESSDQWKDHDPARGMELAFREKAGASADFLGQWRHATEVSFGMLLKDSPRQHLVLALQLVKKSVLGGSNYGSGLKSGLMEGSIGRQAAAGVQCMAIILKSITNKRRLQLLENHSPAFLSSIFSLLSHLQGPHLKLNGVKADTQEFATISDKSIDAAPVVLQCLDILIKLASRAILFPMTASQTGMAVHFPALLFRPFYDACIPPDSVVQHFMTANQQPTSLEGGKGGIESMLSVRLYIASCQLLCALLRHRTRRTGHCIALLEESVKVLLRCLVLPNWQNLPKQASHQVWTVADAKVCASWLRRVYEELGEQKATLGKYAAHLLAEYLCVIAGSGRLAGGLNREVESLLRPGAFALLDACIPRDLQQLHATLADGSQRSALLSLSKDYERNFKYTGKV